ncbi:MAG: Lrp/AsnC ligand binding domain-containing protein [Chloroflexi bacterium]|nr:Lrp/AsnC ligand binding domain-containing protein [Chloroflexota bacterium]
MSVKAYVLVVTDTAKTQGVVRQMRAVPGIAEAYRIMGPYDIVAVLDVEDLSDIQVVLRENIRRIDGVESTLTCVVIPT